MSDVFYSDRLVYSCSGCSNLAQMTNYMALELTRRGVAEMSCIAGVGGNVPALVKKAKSAGFIIALDGCQLHCVKNCLKNHGISPDRHFTLSTLGLRKKHHESFDRQIADNLVAQLTDELSQPVS
ncbi:MAG: putative zinc-binding protein [Ketobacteraceae bacterium]|nr:putative zinc-binding protein [Ketobacteraceae bacterium]